MVFGVFGGSTLDTSDTLFGATILGRYTGVGKSSDLNNTVFDQELLGAIAKFPSASDPPTTFVEAFGRGSIIKEANARRRNLNQP